MMLLLGALHMGVIYMVTRGGGSPAITGDQASLGEHPSQQPTHGHVVQRVATVLATIGEGGGVRV